MNKHECFVSGALGAVLRISRFVGIAPLRFVKKGNGWRVSLSSCLSNFGYFIMAVCNLITTWSVIAGTLYLNQQMETIHISVWTRTERMLWLTEAFIVTSSAATMVYNARGQMRFMITCLNQVQKINSETSIGYRAKQYQKWQMRFLILWMVAIMTITVTDYVVLYTSISFNKAETWLKVSYSLFYVYYWVVQLGIVQLILILLHVRSSFKGVNDNLRNLLQVKATKTPLNHETIRRIASAYASACSVVRDVNRCQGLKLLILLSSLFVALVIAPYYVITNLIADLGEFNQNFTMVFVSEQSIWCLFHVINLVMIIEPCHLTNIEIETTRELVGHLIRHTHSIYNPLTVEVYQFFRLVTLNETSFKPLMVTSMRRGLVIKILGSITTYLAIIIEIK